MCLFFAFERSLKLENLFNISFPLCLGIEKEHKFLMLDIFDFFTVVSQTVVSETFEKSEVAYPKDSYYLLIFILETS